jgi:hypothetical protein
VGPDPDPLIHRKSDSAGNRTRTLRSVARNSVHWTTEAVTSEYRVRKESRQQIMAAAVSILTDEVT